MNYTLEDYKDYKSKYSDLIHNNRKNKSLELFLPNDIFERINKLNISGEHKAVSFCVYTIAKLSTSRETPLPLSVSSLKELLGYSSSNKSLNPIIKKNGILDNASLTITKTYGISEEVQEIINHKSNKVTYKGIVYNPDIMNGNFFKIESEFLLYSLFNKDTIGTIGFYIYSFICLASQLRKNKYAELSAEKYIAPLLGLSAQTVRKYISNLLSLNYIKVKPGNKKYDDYGDFLGNDTNKYLPIRYISKVINFENSITKEGDEIKPNINVTPKEEIKYKLKVVSKPEFI